MPRCEAILRSLPEWFGIESAIVDYTAALGRMETFVAVVDESVGGFLVLNPRTEATAEIHVIAVAREHHRGGLGRALVMHVESLLRARGTEYVQVKTLGPSRPSAPYALTREFYARMGFAPLEENQLWGPVNPCLILVKHLRCGGVSGG